MCLHTMIFYHCYQMVVDYHSKYVGVIKLKDLSAFAIVKSLKRVFNRFTIPYVLLSDNGTNFSDHMFSDFAKVWNFEHKTSSPTYPQSNKVANRYIQTAKKIFKTADFENKDVISGIRLC